VSSTDYAFLTHWTFGDTSREEVFDILANPADLPRWWPSVYLRVDIVSPGDEHGLGMRVALHTKGWLPYTLRWQFRVVDVRRPERIAIEATGDLTGSGVWSLMQHGGVVRVAYDWRIAAEKPLLRAFSWLLKPVFAANHRWAMARGEESLRRELARRRTVSPSTT
jgi:hypothetical protein